MSDDTPFSRYGDPYLNPFPDPYPEDPKPKEEREKKAAPQKESFSPPLVPQPKAPEQSSVPSSEPAIATQPEEEFDEDFNKDILKLVVKIVIFAGLVVAAGFLFWFLMREKTPEPVKPEENAGIEIGESVNLISAEQGGTVLYQDSDGQILEIIVLAGALEKDEEISVAQIAKGSVTNRYQFSPKGLKFLRPVTVKIPYKKNGLKIGETPYDIKLEYQSQAGAQKYLLWYEVDEEAKKLITQVMGF